MLDDIVIDGLFNEFAMLWGARFFDQWKGVDPVELKRRWAEKLGGFHDNPQAIRAALEALEESHYPPTLPEFLGLCRSAAARQSKPTVPMLEYKADPAKRAAALESIRQLLANNNRGSDPMFWATHPKSHIHLEYIFGAAKNDPKRFQPCVQQMIDAGICTENGKLLRRYLGLGQWGTP